MFKYHKINSVYKRDKKGNFTNEFAQSEFEFLFNYPWQFTEKIDGMNIRVFFNHESQKVSFNGRTDNAQIPVSIFEKLQQLFTIKTFKDFDGDVMLFGEGYGNKIQAVGSSYLKDEVDFILFDVKIGRFFLKREDIDNIAEKMNIKSVPVIFEGILKEAVDFFKNPIISALSNKVFTEGGVGVPRGDFLTRGGDRIITKLKLNDFG